MSERIKNKLGAQMLPYAYFAEEIMPLHEAGVSIASNSLQYGSLVFAGIRGFVYEDGIRIFRLRDHWERLMNAAKIMAFDFYLEFDEFAAIMEELVRKNNPQGKFYIRPFIFCDDCRIGPKLDGLTFQLAIYLQSMDNYLSNDGGLRLMTSSFRKYSDNAISTKAKAGGAYLNSMMATHQAHLGGFDEALLFDESGLLTEASVANVIIRYRDRIMTPTLGTGALEGISMRTVRELLAHRGIIVEEAPIDRSTTYVADELLLTGTAVQIAYAESVDGRKMKCATGNGELYQLITEDWQSLNELRHPFAEKWFYFIPNN
ncbi:MAG: aminotransferase class IV [Culicoidibacterales bacterium]